ncbi:MAG TPA: hypothetical protein VG324_08145 [Blastocatellia bacterium]|nr:hypothetical protein [Blastocatellia bacterium]
MSDCPLVRLANNLKHLKKFDESGMVAVPLADWIRFFEALAFMTRDGQRVIYSTIVEGYLVFSKAPFKKKSDAAPKRQDLFDM